MDEILNPESGIQTAELLLATVDSANNNGVTLIFDGQTEATTKRYKIMATGSQIAAGHRVVVMKHSGTYVVLGRLSTNGVPYLWWTSTISSIGTATSIFNATYAYFAKSGRMAELRLKGTMASQPPASQWNKIFTIASGKRPFMPNHYFDNYYDDAMELKSDGSVSIWGNVQANRSVEFVIPYLLE